MGYTLVGDCDGGVHIFRDGILVNKVTVPPPDNKLELDTPAAAASIIGLVPTGRGFAAATCGGWVALCTTAEGPGCDSFQEGQFLHASWPVF